MTTTATATDTKIGKGTRFNSTYADGNPTWEVTRSRGRGVWEAKVVENPDWNGVVKVFTTQEIKTALAWKTFFAKNAESHDGFYASLKPGQTVHYNNGFGNYVRCIVVRDGSENKLKAVALVGNWKPWDLPKRSDDGTINESY